MLYIQDSAEVGGDAAQIRWHRLAGYNAKKAFNPTTIKLNETVIELARVAAPLSDPGTGRKCSESSACSAAVSCESGCLSAK